MVLKINFRLVVLYIYAFIVIYHPDFSSFIGINDFELLGIFTFLYLSGYLIRKDKCFFSEMQKKYFVIFTLLNILATCYFFFRTAIVGTSLTDISSLRIIHGIMPIFYLFSVLIVNHELNCMNYTKKQKYKFIINVALIQVVIALLMYFYKPFKDIAISIYYKGGNATNFYITQNRLHGICNGDYTYSLQILHSIFSLFSLCYAYFYKEKKYYLYSILILFVTFLNGRTGILIFIIGLVLFVFYTMLKTFNLFKILKMFISIICVASLLVYLIYVYSPNTFSLIEHAFVDITSFLNGDTNTETNHFVSMFLWPTGINVLLGCGYRIFGNRGAEFNFYGNSDVGFVNDMFMGGLIYMSLIYSGYMYLILKSKKVRENSLFEKLFLSLLVISIFLSNLKGEVFRSALLMTCTILFPIVFMIGGKEGKLNENNEN